MSCVLYSFYISVHKTYDQTSVSRWTSHNYTSGSLPLNLFASTLPTV